MNLFTGHEKVFFVLQNIAWSVMLGIAFGAFLFVVWQFGASNVINSNSCRQFWIRNQEAQKFKKEKILHPHPPQKNHQIATSSYCHHVKSPHCDAIENSSFSLQFMRSSSPPPPSSSSSSSNPRSTSPPYHYSPLHPSSTPWVPRQKTYTGVWLSKEASVLLAWVRTGAWSFWRSRMKTATMTSSARRKTSDWWKEGAEGWMKTIVESTAPGLPHPQSAGWTPTGSWGGPLNSCEWLADGWAGWWVGWLMSGLIDG